MVAIVTLILFWAGHFLGAFTHEYDLYNECRKHGKAAGFSAEFKCSEMKIDKGVK